MQFKLKTIQELTNKVFDGTANEGDTAECEETKSTYVFENKGWTCVKTKQKGYEHLYGSTSEH